MPITEGELEKAALNRGEAALTRLAESIDLVEKGGAIFLESYVTMPWHVMIRFGKWDEILAEPLRDDAEVFPACIATQHYARGVAYASKHMVAEAEAEQAKFEEALKAPALKGRVMHNNKMYQDPADGPSILNVNRAILAGEIEYRRQFLAKKAGEAADFSQAFGILRNAVDLSLNAQATEILARAKQNRYSNGFSCTVGGVRMILATINKADAKHTFQAAQAALANARAANNANAAQVTPRSQPTRPHLL